ncbi:META domain-containing protein [Corynebacterium flavescens]|uniref:META domain-containing protein n=1 Tax=Corynebacterium flavescens TaxID=28028 RepID=UPI00257E45B9|nr:META domain-containing protein [Corynebacterium sp. UBA5992]
MSRYKGRTIGVAAVALLVAGAVLVGCAESSAREDAVGTWGPGGPGEPQLVLDADGRVSGSDGCNRMMGSWSESDGQIQLSELASTMMACLGDVDTWLNGASKLNVEGDTMHVFDRGGVEIGVLERQQE